MAQLGTFGDIVFEVNHDAIRTWEAFRETHEANYADHDVLDGTQVDEFLNVKLAEGYLSMKLVRGLTDPEADLETLKAMTYSGKAYPLILNGKPKGEFTLRRLGAERRFTDNHGRLVSLQVDLIIKEHKA